MDYIIFGVGTGATLVLIGWMIREWGPWLRDRPPVEDQILSAPDLVMRMAWSRFCATFGMALVFCGVLILVTTCVTLAFDPVDDRGARVVLSAFACAVIFVVVWAVLYMRQFGTAGVIRPKVKSPLSAPVPETTARPESLSPVLESPELATASLEPSFSETMTARGGLGRFSAFFRRDDQQELAHGAQTETIANVNPTEAIIAELTGEASDPEVKELTLGDPLVDPVREFLAGAHDDVTEESLVADVLGDHVLETQERDIETNDRPDAGDAPLDPAIVEDSAESPADDNSSREQALANLRRRRLERLTQPE